MCKKIHKVFQNQSTKPAIHPFISSYYKLDNSVLDTVYEEEEDRVKPSVNVRNGCLKLGADAW